MSIELAVFNFNKGIPEAGTFIDGRAYPVIAKTDTDFITVRDFTGQKVREKRDLFTVYFYGG